MRPIILALISSVTAYGQTYTITTVAGGGLPVRVPGTSARLAPQAVALDRAGNVFFTNEDTVLRLDATTGTLTLVAGNGTYGFSGDNGLATSAQLRSPQGLAVDSAGNLYIADTGNQCIRKVTNGVITTVAGNGTYGFSGDNGPAASAELGTPYGVAVDSAGSLYIADTNNNRIRKVANGAIATVAGNGTYGFGGDNGAATGAQLRSPQGLAVDSAGNLYIADAGNQRIRKVSGGTITTVAGNGSVSGGTSNFSGDGGPATGAQLWNPLAMAVDPAGSLYIADTGNQRVRKVSGGVITTVAGNGTYGFTGDNGPATSAELWTPDGLAVDSAGNLYIADTGNDRIRKVSAGVIATVAGGGAAIAPAGPAVGAQLGNVLGLATGSPDSLYLASGYVLKLTNGAIGTVAGGPAPSSQVNAAGVAVDSAGNLFIADYTNEVIRKVSGGVITTVAGNGTAAQGASLSYGDGGPATSAHLWGPTGVAVDSAGDLYIADAGSDRIRKVSNGVITTIAGGGPGLGDNVPATSVQLNFPAGVAVDQAGTVYIADTDDNRVRKVSNGIIAAVAGNGTTGYSGESGAATDAQLNSPYAIAVDAAGDLFIADYGNHSIRKVTNGIISTVAGDGTQGFSGDGGPATSAEMSYPRSIAVDSAGNLYVADSGNNRIRLLTPGTPPVIATVAPVYSSASVIQPGSWVSIYGSNLASGTALWNGDFPMSLGGTSVSIDGKLAYLWFVSPTQINLQVPDDSTTGPVSVAVTTGSGTAASTVTLAPYGPSFSLLGDGKHVAAEIATPNGTGAYGGGTYDLVGPANTFSFNTRPVRAGETMTLYGVGFGPTNPHVPAGRLFAGVAPTDSPVMITIGGVPVLAGFAAITEAGLYQINVTVPVTGAGDQPIQASVNGVQTPSGPVVSVQ
jgi:uncharacterized protein (TIGR03437 family)